MTQTSDLPSVLRVLVVINRIGASGGAERSTLEIIEGLHGHGFEFMVFALGALLSGFCVFYIRSANLAASWPFLLFMAAVFAAGMSTISSDLNCLSAVGVEDYYRKLRPNATKTFVVVTDGRCA